MFNVVVEWLDAREVACPLLPPRQAGMERREHRGPDPPARADPRGDVAAGFPGAAAGIHPDALHNPRYATELHPFSGGTLLEIRHPSLGWMDFVLPSLERARITRFLSEQEEAWKHFRR